AFLGSPPLVVAFALAGDVNLDILTDPLGTTPAGAPVRLADIWPSGLEVDAALAQAADPRDYPAAYERSERSAAWEALAFVYNDTSPTENYTLSLHDALPI